ncbi:MAG: T9SS type A sorting domain-containing protein, partial [Flavobacteriales bacterium]|nr:T9SS type A sorting domain-containing protein [Flavobacteriales bacterium]
DISFTDISTNSPTSWSWSFTGGTPSSSTSQNPTITYNTAGVYSVTLTATNANGNDIETKSSYISVNDCSLSLETGPNIWPIYCNTTLASKGIYINCNAVVNATQYQFQFIDPTTGNQVTSVTRNKRYFNLYQISGWNFTSTYDLSVRALVNGIWTDYGNACSIGTPIINAPQFKNSHCNRTISHKGVYTVCNANPLTTQYEFVFSEPSSGNVIASVIRTKHYFNLYQISGWSNNTTYDMTVRSFSGGAWTAYSSPCSVTTPVIGGLNKTFRIFNDENDITLSKDILQIKMRIYPNPSRGEFVYLEIEGTNSNSQLLVTDIYGKTVLSKELNSNNETIRFENKLTPGFYMVTVVSDNNKTTKKLIVR